MMEGPTIALVISLAGLVLYLARVNWSMRQTPTEVQSYFKPLTRENIQKVFRDVEENGIDWNRRLPRRKDRRYIVVGGAGLVGGQTVSFLLEVGVPPQAIRIIDARRPTNKGVSEAEMDFKQVDITSETSTMEAVNAPWDAQVSHLPLTVFHTAALIRPFERYSAFYDRCSRVNVGGTANVLSAARKAGASVFVYTSSSNAASSDTNWFFAPWKRASDNYVQFVDEKDFWRPLREAREFPSTYALTKAVAERLVCGADGDGMRTGAIRPGNAVYGSRNDNILGRMLALGGVPTFSAPWVQNWVHKKNVALAHLLYEDALLGEHADKVAGRPYMVSDNGPPIRFRDVYALLDATCTTGFKVEYPPPMLLLLISYAIEWYCLLVVSVPFLRRLGLREIGDPYCLFQPGTFASTLTTIVDDGEARRGLAEGGIGYGGLCSTVEGMCAQVVDWNAIIEEEGTEKKGGR